jgi:RNA polymerase sigma factor (sigma-70 family)
LAKNGKIILTLKNRFHLLNEDLNYIIRGCQQKDAKAQKELFDLFGSKMYGVCLRYCGNRNDAQDVIQEGFLKIYEKIYQFEFKGSFEGWMRRIFVNLALERFRGQYQIINIQDSWRDSGDEGIEGITSSITTDELLKIIQDLSPKYRAVFNLYAIEGYSHKEIAEMLDISEGTSKSNLSRARIILQEKVKLLYSIPLQVRM